MYGSDPRRASAEHMTSHQFRTAYDLERYELPVTRYESLDEFLAADGLPSGILEIGWIRPIHVLYRPEDSETTSIHFHAAVDRNTATLPMFSGLTVTAGAWVNNVYISDPTLTIDSDLNLAWFAGADGLPVQRVLPTVIAKFLDASRSTRLVFWGVSGGGFASLYYSRLFPESLAVCINPQTSILRYAPQFRRAYAAATFGALTRDEGDRLIAERVDADLTTAYRNGFANQVLYLQNADDWHYKEHLLPFADATRRHRSRVRFEVRDWGQGHKPMPTDQLQSLLHTLLTTPGPWPNVLDDAGLNIHSVPEDGP